jgi:hypothetical protein
LGQVPVGVTAEPVEHRDGRVAASPLPGAGRWCGDGDAEFGDQGPDADLDVVADGSDVFEGLTGGVGEFPVEVALRLPG